MKTFLAIILLFITAVCVSAQNVQYLPTGYMNRMVQTVGSASAARAYLGIGVVLTNYGDTVTNWTMYGTTFQGSTTNASLTASRAMVTDANKIESSSVTTLAELAFVSGVTSAIQTQLDAKPASTNTALLNGTNVFTGTNRFTGQLGIGAAPALHFDVNATNETGFVASIKNNGASDTNGALVLDTAQGGVNNKSLSVKAGGTEKFYVSGNGPTLAAASYLMAPSGLGMRFNANIEMIPWDGTRTKIRFGGSDGFQFQNSAAADANLFQVTSSGVKISTGATLANILTGTATLNFDLTALVTEDLTMTVTGAADGDIVTVGVPAGSVTTTIQYTGWVSAPDTVTIRARTAAVGENPASGTFRATVFKF